MAALFFNDTGPANTIVSGYHSPSTAFNKMKKFFKVKG
jgi:hypothetical protein